MALSDQKHPMKTWVIADTHLYHAKMVEYCWRPVDFTEQILDNWNRLVGPDDIVYHLGDVGWRKDRTSFNWEGVVQQLPGHKILVLGNHDRFPIRRYYQMGFMSVVDYVMVRVYYTKGRRNPINFYYRVLLSHKPMDVPEEVDFNLHGHFHNNGSPRWESSLVDKLVPKHRLLSLEEVEYQPVALGQYIHHDWFISTSQRAQEVQDERYT